jgi:hypothetical protein
MINSKYLDLGFDIANFGSNSKALRFKRKPIFVFSRKSNIDTRFMQQICDTYLAIYRKLGGPVSIRVS